MSINDKLREKILDSAIHGCLEKNNESLSPVDIEQIVDDIPFEIPSNWKWCALSKCCAKLYAGGDKTSHFSKDKTEDYQIPVIANGITNDGIIGYTDVATETDSCITISGRGTIGYTSIRTYPFSPVVRLITIKPNDMLNIKYLRYVLNYLVEKSKGTSIQQLTIPMIKNKPIPVPPLLEQEKIANIIDELFELIEKKEKNDQEKDKLKQVLKEKILDNAIHGNLVENNSELKPVKINEVNDDTPYQLPSNWKWTKISSIGDVIGGGTPKTGEKLYWNGNVNWVTPADMKSDNKYITSGKNSITEKGLNESSARLMPKGTIVISSRAPIGYVKISTDDISTSQGCKSIVVNSEEVYNEFVYYYIKAIPKYLNSIGTGTTFREISGKTLGNILIPIPPFEEQKRIIEKIESLFELIEQL